MTASASTPRLRVTLCWYLLLLLAVAVSARPCADGFPGALGDLVALVLIAAASLGRVWTSVFIAGLKDAHLVTTGPYSRCRNPLYALSLVGGTGVGLATGSVTLTVATMVLLFVLYLRAILAEERYLAERHGDAFRQYCAEVPQLWPRGATRAYPASVEVNVAVYAKAFRDAGSFILLFVLLQLIDVLRAQGWLPTLLTLW